MTTEAAELYLNALSQPAALCTPDLRVRRVNPAFRALLGDVAWQDVPLRHLFPPLDIGQLADGEVLEVELPDTLSRPIQVRLSRNQDWVALLVPTPCSHFNERRVRLEKALLEMGREIAGATSEEQLVAVVATGVKRLFPRCSFCVRIVDAKTGLLTSLYAEGKMKSDLRETLVLRRSAAQKTRLRTAGLAPTVQLTDGEVPLLFEGSGDGISAPLVSSGQLFGLINLEYPPQIALDVDEDERLLVQLANQASVGVRNAKLIDELTFVRKYLEELLENANALIVVTDAQRAVEVFNHAFTGLTGLTKEEVLGRDFLELVPESERPYVLGMLSDSLRGERKSFETVVRAPGGREVRVALATACVRSPLGEVEGLTAIGQDLTALRELERQVVQAEKLSSLGTLAASVAHEINNPMTAVQAYVESLLEHAQVGRPPPADQAEKLRKIFDNIQRILRFTHDLVSYARPQSDRPKELSLHPTLDMAVSFCSLVIEQHGVFLEKKYGEVPPLLGVPGLLVQVFVNLITNACHATQSGGTVRLSTGIEEGRAVVRIADNGVGISPENLERIFQPFFSTKPAGKGTGLGLSIVHGIVTKHGGKIEVESVAGQGTTFAVRLPLPTAL